MVRIEGHSIDKSQQVEIKNLSPNGLQNAELKGLVLVKILSLKILPKRSIIKI